MVRESMQLSTNKCTQVSSWAVFVQRQSTPSSSLTRLTISKLRSLLAKLKRNQLTISNHQSITKEKPFAVSMEPIVDILTLIRLGIGMVGS